MKRMRLIALIVLVLALTLTCAACGEKEPVSTQPGTVYTPSGESGLAQWSLSTSTWSSPNGATVHLFAAPKAYQQGMTAAFVVRLEGEDVEVVPCQWDGTNFTADAELNAADGYCYYVQLTDDQGEMTEYPVNTPTEPTDESLINMASALECFCNVTVTASDDQGGALTILEGTAQVQPPRITNEGQAVTCTSAVLILTSNGQELTRVELASQTPGSDGSCTWQLTGTAFQLSAVEDDRQVELTMEAVLSNGQVLTASGCTWLALDGNLLLAVG